ncbi:PAAR domain-containing protein [Paraburkholderia sp. Ac-20347]|uniref:PAAR domain-containing protein n=1 Tax=Paraburkholderia sp. Ac-20347 TaxID=2703892 RepID=UPI00197D0C08|nr:PAAR domain-containing protein [Paraburkholderia sp. Ac-20347]MBN3812363.1 PAAR domain-containing protein [Paraburkholderia sp. Ac-20347]
MTTPAATLGTSTTHGGAVVTAARCVTIGGIPAARVGDMVTCPMRGPAVITSGGLGTIDGCRIAHHGSSTSCGATPVVTGGGPTV